MKRNKKPVLRNSKYQDSLLNSLKTYSGFPPRRPGCFRRGRNFLQVTFTTLHADLVKSILIKVYLLFISFAPPKETKQRKEAFLYEFFDNEVKNRFQNFASLRAFAPVLKAFDPRASWLLAANSHRLFFKSLAPASGVLHCVGLRLLFLF
jgi:hypothetical protein